MLRCTRDAITYHVQSLVLGTAGVDHVDVLRMRCCTGLCRFEPHSSAWRMDLQALPE